MGRPRGDRDASLRPALSLLLHLTAVGRAVIAVARAGVIGHRSLPSSFPRPLLNDVRATLAALRGQGVIAHPRAPFT